MLFGHLLHVTLNASQPVRAPVELAARTALPEQDTESLPAPATDDDRMAPYPHDKRASNLMVRAESMLQIPQDEYLDILDNIRTLEGKVAALLPPGVAASKKPDSNGQGCATVAVNDESGQASNPPPPPGVTTISVNIATAVAKQDRNGALSSGGRLAASLPPPPLLTQSPTKAPPGSHTGALGTAKGSSYLSDLIGNEGTSVLPEPKSGADGKDFVSMDASSSPSATDNVNSTLTDALTPTGTTKSTITRPKTRIVQKTVTIARKYTTTDVSATQAGTRRISSATDAEQTNGGNTVHPQPSTTLLTTDPTDGGKRQLFLNSTTGQSSMPGNESRSDTSPTSELRLSDADQKTLASGFSTVTISASRGMADRRR